MMSELTAPLRNLPSTNSKDGCYDRIGQRLMGLVKLDNNGMCYEKESEILELLFRLEIVIQRYGLGYLSPKEASTAAAPTNYEDVISVKIGGNKRQKKAISRSTPQKEEAATSTTEEELILLGITRILSHHQKSLTHLSMEAAANVILALTTSCASSTASASSSSATASATNTISNNSLLEHIAKYSSQWLSSLQKQLESLLQKIDTTRTYFGVHPDALVPSRTISKGENQQNAVNGNVTTTSTTATHGLTSCMLSCLQAATSVIAYVGRLRISKIVSSSIVQNLNATAWKILGCCSSQEDSTLLQSASTLIATLPLAKVSSWTDTFLVTLASMASVAHRAYPGASTTTLRTLDWIDRQQLKQIRQRLLDCSYDNNCHDWLQTLPICLPLQEERVIAINQRINGLTHILLSYMNQHHDNDTTVLTVNFPITHLLDTCELLLTFGTGAESRYNKISSSSTNRSRREITTTTIPDENAILSLRFVLQIMNGVRYNGHSLLTAALSTVGSTMLPHAKRIATLIEITLLSSCSAEIQSLVVVNLVHNSTSSTGGTTNNGSIALRSKAIQTAKVAMGTLGSGATALFMKTSQLIAGCLLEMLFLEENILGNKQSSWGSTSERTALIIKGLEALSTYVNVGGHLLPLPARSKLEGVVRSAVDTIITRKNSSSEIKVALLQLGMSVTSMPWIDGGISNLLPIFVELGKAYQQDRDDAVVRNAFLLVNLCNTVSTPRSVPLMNATNIHHRSIDTSDISLAAQLRLNAASKQDNGEHENSQQQQSLNNANVSSISLVPHDQVCNATIPNTDDNTPEKEPAAETKSLNCDHPNALLDQEAYTITNGDDMKISSKNLIADASEAHHGNSVAPAQPPYILSNNPIANQELECEILNKETVETTEGKSQQQNACLSKQFDDDDDDDDDFPKIIDCDPDEE